MQSLEQSNASYSGQEEELSAQGERYDPSNATAMVQQTQNENNVAITNLCSALSFEQQYCSYDQQYLLPSQCPQTAIPAAPSVFTPDGIHPYTAHTLTCDQRYYKSGNECIPLPSNAYATTTSPGWLCNSGYSESGNTCVLPANGTVVDGIIDCDAGYVENPYNQCVQQTSSSTPSTPITTSVVSSTITITTTPNIVPLPFPPINENLRVGADDEAVVALQQFLESKGDLTIPTGTTLGYFGSFTKQAVVKFQTSAGLPATGYCGPMTRAVINADNHFQ
jgi:hypothetical protein